MLQSNDFVVNVHYVFLGAKQVLNVAISNCSQEKDYKVGGCIRYKVLHINIDRLYREGRLCMQLLCLRCVFRST